MKKSSRLMVFLFCAGLVILLTAPRMIQVNRLRHRSQELEKELTRLRIENQALENELRLLRDDPVYLERVAREKLNKAKEGEIVYKVVRSQ